MIEERLLASLRSQLQQGLLTLPEYDKAARNAIKALVSERSKPVRMEGSGTLRLVLHNTRKQLQMGLITQEEALKLKQAAVQAKSIEMAQRTPPSSRSDVQRPSSRDQGMWQGPLCDSSALFRKCSLLPFNAAPILRVTPRKKDDLPLNTIATATTRSPAALEEYTPFISPRVDSTVESTTNAISLDLQGVIVGTAPIERRKILGTRSQTGFIVKITSGRGNLEVRLLVLFFLVSDSPLMELGLLVHCDSQI